MKHIPNIITLMNLFCGCLAIIWLADNRIQDAALLIFLAAVLDFLDGMVARLLKAYSDIGKELDSLADVVSFGVVPGLILFALFQEQSGANLSVSDSDSLVPYVALLVPLLSAYRLAKFNIDTRQKEYFIGLPTPANSLCIASMALIPNNPADPASNLFHQPAFLAVFSIVCSFLLIAEIPLFSLKSLSSGWGANKGFGLLIGISLVTALLLGFAAGPVILIFYLILSYLFPPVKNTP
ncbi:MAG: hypothetical protein RLZZ630_1405 [Bacteroidota bacterium]|jgi:CDP-diacylglycerol--serine O-phosphatidyltransferase